MTANEYNQKQLDSGDLSISNVTTLVEAWQRLHPPLAVDGYCGPNTIASLNPVLELVKIWPLLSLSDGRVPVITSGFYTENGSRPTHKGVDMFFKWLDKDPDVKVGNCGAIMRNGKRRWWYPDGYVAVAAADGTVSTAGDTHSGWRCWVDHADGNRTGYFHGASLLVREGQKVSAGDLLIVVGCNPNNYNAKHLHFEVSPIGKYAPMNPRVWLKDASYQS
jgi:murein DD-endopeptidase MepM/ murein hydrolase activator NlpD